MTPQLNRDLVRWLAPGDTLAARILFVWVTAEMPAGDFSLPAFGWSTLATPVANTAGLILTRNKRLR